MTVSSDLAVVVVNYGSHDLLARNLAPVSAFCDGPVIVVDSRTTDAERIEVNALAQEHGWLTVLPDTNTGYGIGMNLGVARAIDAGASYIMLLNPDATIDESSLAALVDIVRRDPLTMTSPLVVSPDKKHHFKKYEVDLTVGAVRPQTSVRHVETHRNLPWLSGACLVLSTHLWEKVGGMDPRYFLYWEDVDFSLRVLKAGGSLVNDTNAVAIHDQGGTQEKTERRQSSTYYYYNIRNRLLLGAGHATDSELRRWLLATPRESWRILKHGGRKQILTHPGQTLVPLVRGIADGVVEMSKARRAARRAASHTR